MGLKSASMGSLLQGVNQQPDRVRLDGQVTEQINMISDVTTGLSTRPGSQEVSEISAIGDNPKYQNIVFNGEEYIISWDELASGAKLQISSLDGSDFTVLDTTGTSLSYIGEDMVFTVVEDQIIATNRDKVVETLDLVDEQEWRVALFQALGGEFLRTYEVDLSFSDGEGNPRIEVSGTYITPDGTGSQDAEETTSDYIMEQLVTSLLADPNLPAGTTIERKFDVASVYHPSRDIEITLSDGSGGTILRGFSNSIKNPEDLTRYAPNGKVVEVTNSPASEDNYWLKFETVNTILDNFTNIVVNGDFATGDFTGWVYSSLSTNWSIGNQGTVANPDFRAYLAPTDTIGGSVLTYNIDELDQNVEATFEIDWVQGEGYSLIIQSNNPALTQITITLPSSGTGVDNYSVIIPAGYTSLSFAYFGSNYNDATAELFLDNFVINVPITEDGRIGFGTEGVWRESYNPYQVRDYNPNTMPHVISLNESGEFILDSGPWLGRPVGDSETAPFASIVGKTIRDTTGFEGRLVLLTPETLVMSRTNEAFDLWRESATVISDTDVIDIKSTKKNSLGMSWLVPFDRDLFIFSDPGDSQFIVSGGGLTPNNASMVLTTEFEMNSAGARPQSTGRTILFPFAIGEFSGVKEFYTSADVAVNAANTLTETQNRYINGQVTQIEVSQNFNISLFRAETNNTIWVYKYLWDSDEVLQSSWSKWEFRDELRYMFFVNNLLYLVSKDANDNFYLHSLNLNRPLGEFGYTEAMDRRKEVTPVFQNESGGTSIYTVKLESEYRFIFKSGAGGRLDFGEEVEPFLTAEVSDGVIHYLSSDDIGDSSVLTAGQGLEWTLQPTQAFGMDYQQRVDTSKNVTVQEYAIHTTNSGTFQAYGTSPYSDDWTYDPFQFTPSGVLRSDQLTYTGTFYIPWGERADWSTFVLKGSDTREVTILELEWIGQIINTKGRRQ